ncbi:MAG: hypothetical protein ACLU4J_26080 [Butyricimonas paravirosa]
MKIKILYIGLSIFLLSWIIPSLVQLTMDSSPRYPFTYYSSVINQFCYLDQDNDNVRGKDMSGKVYSERAGVTHVLLSSVSHGKRHPGFHPRDSG